MRNFVYDLNGVLVVMSLTEKTEKASNQIIAATHELLKISLILKRKIVKRKHFLIIFDLCDKIIALLDGETDC